MLVLVLATTSCVQVQQRLTACDAPREQVVFALSGLEGDKAGTTILDDETRVSLRDMVRRHARNAECFSDAERDRMREAVR